MVMYDNSPNSIHLFLLYSISVHAKESSGEPTVLVQFLFSFLCCESASVAWVVFDVIVIKFHFHLLALTFSSLYFIPFLYCIWDTIVFTCMLTALLTFDKTIASRFYEPTSHNKNSFFGIQSTSAISHKVSPLKNCRRHPINPQLNNPLCGLFGSGGGGHYVPSGSCGVKSTAFVVVTPCPLPSPDGKLSVGFEDVETGFLKYLLGTYFLFCSLTSSWSIG